jgi:WhiB family redox-sensing transcriptional regulator
MTEHFQTANELWRQDRPPGWWTVLAADLETTLYSGPSLDDAREIRRLVHGPLPAQPALGGTTMNHHDTDWMAQATCRDLDTNYFFRPELETFAVLTCRRCPVQDTCLKYALALHIDEGVYGGATEKERRRIRRRRRKENQAA